MSFAPVIELKKYLPDRTKLDSWQAIQYDMMVWMMQEQLRLGSTYKWVAGHDGCFNDHYYKQQRFLQAYKGSRSWTYCCGITLEHFYMSWSKFIGERINDPYHMDAKFIWELRGHFFVYRSNDNRYDKGAGGGIEALGQHLDDLAGGENDFAIFTYHDDPYSASFGDYVQIQNKQDIHSVGGGHSAIVVDLREEEGSDVLVVFNSNVTNDYGFDQGVGLSWYKLDKKDKQTKFRRRFHFGSVQPLATE